MATPADFKKRRKRIEDRIISVMDTLDRTGDNGRRYAKMFREMDDKAFAQYMQYMKDRKVAVNIIMPNMTPGKNLQIPNLLQAAKDVGLKTSHRLWLYDRTTGRKYLTNEKYLVLDLPIRRAQQEWDKKLSVPDRDRKIDALTGQVTGDDRACALSAPEIQSLGVRGLHQTMTELVKVRGGDVNAYGDFNRQLMENGEATLSSLDPRTRARSATMAKVLLESMLISNNL